VTDAGALFDVTTTVNVEGINRGLSRAPAVMAEAVRDGLEHALLGFRKDFLANPGVKIKTRGRGLGNRRRWPVRVTGKSLDKIIGTIGTKADVAGILERGGTITGKGGRMLALPLALALRADGQKKREYASPERARAAGKRFIEIRRGNRVILYELTAKRGKVKGPAFLLVPRVTIPALLRFYSTWSSPPAMAARIRRLNQNIDKGLEKIFGPEAVTQKST
jgi:hypothetical protein